LRRRPAYLTRQDLGLDLSQAPAEAWPLSWAALSASRRARPWLGQVAVPLAMTATMDTAALDASLWITWPLLIAMAWYFSPQEGFATATWAWIVSIEAGTLSSQWSLIGAYSLAAWPDSRLLTGAIWIAVMLALAGTFLWTRRRGAGLPGPIR